MKIKYIGPNYVAFKENKIYEVISIEKGWYRIMSEIDESYLLPPKVCEVVEGSEDEVPHWRIPGT